VLKEGTNKQHHDRRLWNNSLVLYFYTYFFQTLLKPVESHNNHQDIDGVQVCDDRNEVYEQLLVGFEFAHIDPGSC